MSGVEERNPAPSSTLHGRGLHASKSEASGKLIACILTFAVFGFNFFVFLHPPPPPPPPPSCLFRFLWGGGWRLQCRTSRGRQNLMLELADNVSKSVSLDDSLLPFICQVPGLELELPSSRLNA